MAGETSPPPDLREILTDAFGPFLEIALDFATAIWWFWLLVLGVLAARLLRSVYRRLRLARSGIGEIDAMDGTTFEHYLGMMFRRLGYGVEQVGSSRGDYGADLVIRRNGTRTVVQAKCYRGGKVGPKAVQEAVGAKPMYDCSEAMVVTNSEFTQAARTLAAAHGVELWGREQLVRKLLRARSAQRDAEPAEREENAVVPEAPLPPIEAREDSQVTCAECAEPVSDKVRDYCRAHAESFGGSVYCYAHQRRFRQARRRA